MKHRYNKPLFRCISFSFAGFKLCSAILLAFLITSASTVQTGVKSAAANKATFGDFTEVTPIDSLFVTPADRDFWVITTAPSEYDNDGDLDIAVLGYYVVYTQSVDYRLMLMRNNGPSGTDVWTFTSVDVPLGGLSNGESDLACGDLDGDGDQDLAMGTDGYTVIYRNDAGSMSTIESQVLIFEITI